MNDFFLLNRIFVPREVVIAIGCMNEMLKRLAVIESILAPLK